MNDTSIVTRSKVGRRAAGRSASSVRALTRSRHDHARIGAQPPVELAVADVERDDARARRARSSTSVKPPVDAPMSSAIAPSTVDAEARRGRGELEAAAADVRMVGAQERDVGVVGDGRAGLVGAAGRRRATWPARISARARSRDGARPRSTSSVSSRDGLLSSDLACGATTQSAIVGEAAAEPGAAERRHARASAHSAASRARLRRGRRAPDRSACRRAASLPAVLPRSADAPSTSRMSSTIWNARPSAGAVLVDRRILRRSRRRP